LTAREGNVVLISKAFVSNLVLIYSSALRAVQVTVAECVALPTSQPCR